MKQSLVDRGWIVILVLLILMFAFAWFADSILKMVSAKPAISGAQLAWLVGLVVVFAGVLVAGIAINGRWSGAFIDSRNRYSLSQVQAVMWLIIVSSGIVAAGVGNVVNKVESPLDLAIPTELLAVIGLSATTLVGSPIVRSVKKKATPDPGQAGKMMTSLGADRVQVQVPQPGVGGAAGARVAFAGSAAAAPPVAGMKVFGFSGAAVEPTVMTEGTVVTLTDPNKTTWIDLLSGEETGNADKVDLGKVQLLYVTAAAIFVYGVALFGNLNPALDADGHATRMVFAELNSSLVGILGLSTAGALAYLAAPHANTVE